MAGHGKVQDAVEVVPTPRSFVTCRSVQDGLEQISVGACIGERENEFAVGRIEIEKYPIIFDTAVTESLKVARKRMVSVLWRQGFAHGKFENDIIDLVDVFAAPDHLLQAFSKAFRLEEIGEIKKALSGLKVKSHKRSVIHDDSIEVECEMPGKNNEPDGCRLVLKYVDGKWKCSGM